MNDVLDCLLTRRSIKKYTTQPVEREKLEQIVQAGTYAANGSGIPPEVLERLNSHVLIPGGPLGLNNVDRIVRLSYDESCGLSAYPNEGGGSCVQLRLPMQKGEDHAQGTDR